MKKLLVTGAAGFVGGALSNRLLSEGARVVGTSRSPGVELPFTMVCIPAFTNGSVLRKALSGIEVVVHCAARVHVMDDPEADPLTAFRDVNVDGTIALARQAAATGVRRFIFISSVKVNGELSTEGCPFTADDVSNPEDAYGISKMEAEEGLRALAAETGMEVVIIRPPLVYGPGVKANFRSMMNWIKKGVPLPLGAINNKRSLVALDNLVDLIATCADHPNAANRTFLVSDDEDLSTTELLQRLASAMDVPSRLLPVPSGMLEMGASLLGRKAIVQRLCGSLQLDITKTKELLGWLPPVTVNEALRRTAEDFLAHQSGR